MSTPTIIWSLGHGAPLQFTQAKAIIDLGLEYGIDGIELRPCLETFLLYERLPHLQAGLDTDLVNQRRLELRRIVDYAKQREFQLGIWLEAPSGPGNLLELWPDIKSAAGDLDVRRPLFEELIQAQAREFCEAFPEFDEIVVSLRDGRTAAAPPLKRRAHRMLDVIVAAFQPFGKHLIVRPFSLCDDQRKAVFSAIADLKADANVTIVEPTEPYLWNPFVLNNPYLTKLEKFGLRAETDAGAEHYGRSLIPACCPGYLIERLQNAWEKGCASYVLRADFAGSTAVHTLNEINLVAATLWLRDHDIDLQQEWHDWLCDRFDTVPAGLPHLLEQTFEIIKRALYIDCQPISPDAFPSFAQAKQTQYFHLFESSPHLKHLKLQRSVQTDRGSKPHEDLIQEKSEACEMAQALMTWFESMAGEMDPDSARSIYGQLEAILFLCRGMSSLVRLTCAHLQEAWNLKPAANDFETEATAYLETVSAIAAKCGESFFADMPGRMRAFLDELRAEREVERPLRQRLSGDESLLDSVVCGLASEGHRLSLRPGCGTPGLGGDNQPYRRVGPGPEASISYELKFKKGQAARLEIDFLADGPIKANLTLGKSKFGMCCAKAGAGELVSLGCDIPATVTRDRLRLEISNATNHACRIAQIRVVQS